MKRILAMALAASCLGGCMKTHHSDGVTRIRTYPRDYCADVGIQFGVAKLRECREVEALMQGSSTTVNVRIVN